MGWYPIAYISLDPAQVSRSSCFDRVFHLKDQRLLYYVRSASQDEEYPEHEKVSAGFKVVIKLHIRAVCV